MTGWVIAHSPDLIEPGERAFVVQLGNPDANRLTYSSLMSDQDCEAIDFGAYRDARSWYLEDGRDTTILEGVSLGRAFEYAATETLVRHRRAAHILQRLLADSEDKTVRLRGMGDEWWTMARALGAEPIVEGPGLVTSAMTGVHPTPPSRSCRLTARVASVWHARRPWLVLVGARVWGLPYHRRLLRRASALLVDPGRRVISCAVGQGARTTSIWLSDFDRHGRLPAATDLAVSSPERAAIAAVEVRFDLLRDMLASCVGAGRRAGRRGVVAIAAQDVMPPQRAFLLGLQAAGGKVITLEHGLSGGYAEQVLPVADVFAAWGEPQAVYTRNASQPGLRVESVGCPRLETCELAPPPSGDDTWDLVHFSQPTEDLSAGNWAEEHLLALQLVEEYARLHPERRVAIKLHPSSYVVGFRPPPPQHAPQVTTESLALIRSARVVLVDRSTTGLEAMCLGRPVLQVTPRGYIGPVEFIGDSGASIRVDSVEELGASTEHLLANLTAYGEAVERGRAYAAVFINGLGQPGAAVQRLVDLVAELRQS